MRRSQASRCGWATYLRPARTCIIASSCIALTLANPLALAAQTAAPSATILTIQQKIAAGDLAGAEALLHRTRQQYPRDGGIENLLGVAEVQAGHPAAARDAFQQAVRLSPRLVSAYLNLARLLLTEHPGEAERRKALDLYGQVLRIDPANGEAHFQRATLMLQAGDYAASQKELAQLNAEVTAQANVQALACADAFGLQQSAAALAAFNKLVASPDLQEEDAALVLPALRKAHRADLVETLFTAVAQRKPLSPSGVRTLGLAQEAEGRLPAARETLERAFASQPSNVLLLIDLTRVALAQNDSQAALGYLAHARALRANDPDLAFQFGLVCLKLNLLGEALKAMGEALRLAPDTPSYNLEYGALTMMADDPARALPYLIKYQRLKPGDPEGDLALGAAYFAHNQYPEADPWLRLALKSERTAGAANFYHGSILRRNGDPARALTALKESERQNPEQPDVHAELGQAYMELKQNSDAETELQRALTLDPANYAANFALVRLYARTGDPRQQEQLKRFEQLRDKKSQDYSLAMRVIESRPIPQAQATP